MHKPQPQAISRREPLTAEDIVYRTKPPIPPNRPLPPPLPSWTPFAALCVAILIAAAILIWTILRTAPHPAR